METKVDLSRSDRALGFFGAVLGPERTPWVKYSKGARLTGPEPADSVEDVGDVL